MWSGTVAEFLALARSGQLTSILRRRFLSEGRSVSPYEEHSWDESLPAVAAMLEGQGLDAHYMQILVEVALPQTSARADVVLLGMDSQGGRGVVVLELKHWSGRNIRGSQPEMVELGDDYQKLHPCAQVQGYRDYIRTYHAAIVDRTPAARVHGCAYLHKMVDVGRLTRAIRRRRRKSMPNLCGSARRSARVKGPSLPNGFVTACRHRLTPPTWPNSSVWRSAPRARWCSRSSRWSTATAFPGCCSTPNVR